MTAPASIRNMIVQLMSHMSGSKEVRTYLQRFAGAKDRFAVIKIGGAIIDEELEATAAALAFLHQVGLTPVVIHGGGPQLDRALTAKNITTTKIDGLRVTTPEVLDVARKVFLQTNLKLVEAVRRHGVEAHSVHAGVIEARFKDREKFGFVGEAEAIQDQSIRSVIRFGAIPIMTCLGVAPGGQLVNINGDAVVAALVHGLQPMKIVFLTGVGGLLGGDGEIIDSINLKMDFAAMMSEPWVHSGMKLKLQEIKRLLDNLPLDSSISITSPAQLIRELFTHGGAGTNVRRGELVLQMGDKTGVDVARLSDLIEAAFGRGLKSDWWPGVDLLNVFVSEEYRIAAVVTKLASGAAYLDKFAVCESARGEGLAKTVWQNITQRHPVFFLRSRNDNGFTEFYRNMATGSLRDGEWTVFWHGDITLAKAAPIVAEISALPESFTS